MAVESHEDDKGPAYQIYLTSLFVRKLQIDFHTQTLCTCQSHVAALNVIRQVQRKCASYAGN